MIVTIVMIVMIVTIVTIVMIVTITVTQMIVNYHPEKGLLGKTFMFFYCRQNTKYQTDKHQQKPAMFQWNNDKRWW